MDSTSDKKDFLNTYIKSLETIDISPTVTEDSKKSNELIEGETIYYYLIRKIMTTKDDPLSIKEVVEKFRTVWNIKYLTDLAKLQKQNKPTEIDDSETFQFIQTGGFGVLFYINNLVVKYIYHDQIYTNMTCAEYDIPNIIKPRLMASGCGRLISRPKTAVMNIDISYLHDVYKRLMLVIHLIWCTWKNINPDLASYTNCVKSAIKKYKELSSWSDFSYFFKPIYMACVSKTFMIQKNIINMIYFFEVQKRCRFTNGSILMYDRAISSMDNLYYNAATDDIEMITNKLTQTNLFVSHPAFIREFFLQVFIVLYNIYYTFPTFLHYDMKLNNVLVNKNIDQDSLVLTATSYDHPQTCQIFVFRSKYHILLHDFDFSGIGGKYLNVKFTPHCLLIDNTRCNWYFELRKIASNLIKHFPHLKESDGDFLDFLETQLDIKRFMMALTDKKKEVLGEIKPLSQLYQLITDQHIWKNYIYIKEDE